MGRRTVGGSTKRLIGLIGALLFVVVLAGSWLRIEASRDRIEVNNCVFGADAATYAAALDAGIWRGLKPRKHPAAVAAVQAVATPLLATGLSPRQASSGALAFWQAFGALVLFLGLCRNLLPPVRAFLVTLLFLSSFGAMTLFGIVETYGITFAFSAIALAILAELAALAARLPWRSALGAGVVVGVAGLANPPAMVILFPYTAVVLARHGSFRRLVVPALLLPAAIAVCVALLPGVVVDGIAWELAYADRYGGTGHLGDGPLALAYTKAFLLFAFVSPLDRIVCSVNGLGLGMMSGPRLLALALSVGLIGVGILRSLMSARSRPLAAGCLFGTFVLYLFYGWFNPGEALLYSTQWLLLLVVAAAPGLARPVPAAAIAGVVAVQIAVNATPLQNPASHDPAACCRLPPHTMLPHEHPLALAKRNRGCGESPR